MERSILTDIYIVQTILPPFFGKKWLSICFQIVHWCLTVLKMKTIRFDQWLFFLNKITTTNMHSHLLLIVSWFTSHVNSNTSTFGLLHIFKCSARIWPEFYRRINTFSEIFICSQMWTYTTIQVPPTTRLSLSVIGIKIGCSDGSVYPQKYSTRMNNFNISI